VQDVLLGLLAIGVGGLFCFRGYLTMRLIIAVWGAFSGFLFGAGLVDRWTDGVFLANAAAWLLGVVVAIAFGLLAYLYYEVSVVLAMAAVGFVLGASMMVALDIRWSWVVVAVGVLVGISLAVLAVVGRLPMLLLTVLTALAGAATIVGGIMLLTGVLAAADLSSQAVVSRIDDSTGWWVLYLVLAVTGVVLQVRLLDDLRRSVREQWAADGGRELQRERQPR
jgi:predicted outer membrane lipoprotein